MSQNTDNSRIFSGADTANSNTPSPPPRVSLPVRYSNPTDPDSERPVDEVEVDEIFVRTGESVTATTDLIQNVTNTLEEVDQFVGRTQNILDQTIYEPKMSEEDGQSVLIDVASLEKTFQTEPTGQPWLMKVEAKTQHRVLQ